jgi:hypothetical protein
MWLKLAPYLIGFAIVASLLAWVDHRAYNSGKAAAEKVCTETTVPAAEAKVQAVCDAMGKATKEENDALYADLNTLRSTYDRLRNTKPIIAKCLPLTSTCGGNARSDEAPQSATGVGVHTEWLDRTFYDAATDIARGESCQRQLKNIYVLNGKL